MSRFFKWSLPYTLSNKTFARISHLSHAHYMPQTYIYRLRIVTKIQRGLQLRERRIPIKDLQATGLLPYLPDTLNCTIHRQATRLKYHKIYINQLTYHSILSTKTVCVNLIKGPKNKYPKIIKNLPYTFITSVV
jgi:hypothetical protein